MDIPSMELVPLLTLGSEGRQSKTKIEEQKELAKNARRVKVLITLKKKDKTDNSVVHYTKYTMKLKKGISSEDILKVHHSIDRMVASSLLSGSEVFQEGKTASDLKKVFDRMLYSNILCFDELNNIYMKDIKQDIAVIEEPIRVFLGLFDIVRKKEYTERELAQSIERNSQKNRKAWSELRKSIHSAPDNTVLLRNIQRKNSYYERERRHSEALTRKIVKRKRK